MWKNESWRDYPHPRAGGFRLERKYKRMCVNKMSKIKEGIIKSTQPDGHGTCAPQTHIYHTRLDY